MGETRTDKFKPNHSSAGRRWGFNRIYGAADGTKQTVYMTRLWIGRLRFHVFHRGDQDPDCHDHPWGFWTFPLRSYVEEVVDLTVGEEPVTRRQVVRAFRLHYRPATHTHRVLGPWGGQHLDELSGFVPSVVAGVIPTIVFTERPSRKWGFLKNRAGEWCWMAWKKYVYEGGKQAPCSEPEPDYMRLSQADYEDLFGKGSAD